MVTQWLQYGRTLRHVLYKSQGAGCPVCELDVRCALSRVIWRPTMCVDMGTDYGSPGNTTAGTGIVITVSARREWTDRWPK